MSAIHQKAIAISQNEKFSSMISVFGQSSIIQQQKYPLLKYNFLKLFNQIVMPLELNDKIFYTSSLVKIWLIRDKFRKDVWDKSICPINWMLKKYDSDIMNIAKNIIKWLLILVQNFRNCFRNRVPYPVSLLLLKFLFASISILIFPCQINNITILIEHNPQTSISWKRNEFKIYEGPETLWSTITVIIGERIYSVDTNIGFTWFNRM